MASTILPLLSSPTPTLHHHHRRRLFPTIRRALPVRCPISTPPPLLRRISRNSNLIFGAYITGPASDPIVAAEDPKVDFTDFGGETVVQPPPAISWGILWKLIARHKLRVAASVVSLLCCTTCTLSMPIFSGRFFEVLIGARPEPLWQLLSKIGVLYSLEPIFTVIYVVNMNTIWEKVMSSLRAQIFHSVLIHKVEFFDKYKVGELTALLTSDLGSLKGIVSDNISRDRGFRALTEARNSTLSKSHWNNILAFRSSAPTCTSFGDTYAYSICFSW